MFTGTGDQGGESGAVPPTRAFTEEYRDGVSVAPFLLVTVDVLTTTLAAAVPGPVATSGTALSTFGDLSPSGVPVGFDCHLG